MAYRMSPIAWFIHCAVLTPLRWLTNSVAAFVDSFAPEGHVFPQDALLIGCCDLLNFVYGEQFAQASLRAIDRDDPMNVIDAARAAIVIAHAEASAQLIANELAQLQLALTEQRLTKDDAEAFEALWDQEVTHGLG